MAAPPLPAAYVERMRTLLGDEAGLFFASYDRLARPGIRVNLGKITAEEFAQRSPWPLEPIPWCETGFYLPDDAPAGKHPWYAAGVYYLQEPSAMAPVEQMGFSLTSWAVDLCAAPGGKSTQILDKLTPDSLLIANEVVESRIKPLGENLERWGADLAVITNLEVRRVADLLPNRFDTALVDAPCSGEGLFRRHPDARSEWSLAHVEGSARRQQALLRAAAPLVGTAGTLIYSTCTFAPEENEQIISAFLDEHPMWSLQPIEGFAPGRTDWVETRHDLSGMARLWPHQLEGDGHTIARLQRSEDDPDIKPGLFDGTVPEPSKAASAAFDDFCRQSIPTFESDGILTQQGDGIYILPAEAEMVFHVPMVRRGLWAGTLAPGRFTPSHALALHLDASACSNVETLDFEEAAHYLSGETLTKPGRPGWILMTLDGFPLGWGKRSGDVIKNHYPKGLRRPVASWMSAAP